MRFDGQKVIAVTHAGFIVATFLLLFAVPRPGTGARIDPAYASITEWERLQPGWRLVRFNDATYRSRGLWVGEASPN
jgi:probable phosphoglycerate mutase